MRSPYDISYTCQKINGLRKHGYGDMRKLVYNKEDLQLLSSKTKDFPILREKLFIPYNEVKSQKNQRQSIGQKSSNKSQKQPPVNQFYKFQSTNCEDFIGNRDFHLQMG